VNKHRNGYTDSDPRKCNRQLWTIENIGELKQLGAGSRDMALFVRCELYRMSVSSLFVELRDPFDCPNRRSHFLFDIFNSAV
jgi:hypothetical protein